MVNMMLEPGNRKKYLVYSADSTSPYGVPLPKHYQAFFLLFNKNYLFKYDKEPASVKFRLALLKKILTVCEMIAQW